MGLIIRRIISNCSILKCSSGRATIRSYRVPAAKLNVIKTRYFATSGDGRSVDERSKTSGGNEDSGGYMSWWAFGAFLVVGGAGAYFMHRTKQKKEQELVEIIEKNKGTIGKALLGGPWELVNFDNKLMSWRDYLGKWVIVYFGFTHCPDICPEELEKLCHVIENLKKDPAIPRIHPLFFTVDPYRDRPDNIKKYCQEYSPDLVGFSGTVEQVAKVCKMFRVYFSEGPKTADDYIVDHSIVMYLMNPEGEFVEHYTRETAERRMEIRVRKRILEYEESKKSA